MPDLNFHLQDAAVLPFAAVPSLQFRLVVQNRTAERLHAVMLKVQVQIVTTQRLYSAAEQARLMELFGAPERWGTTLKNIFWVQTVVMIPAFAGETAVNLIIPCTYDFEVVSAKYFHALEDGDIPLEFLFSGTMFYAGGVGLQVGQIPWDKEAAFRLPVATWRGLMAHYFPDSAWLRLRQDVFDQLYRYKAERSLPTWEATLAQLLAVAGAEAPAWKP